VTVLVYGDFECPHTRALILSIAHLQQRDDNPSRYVYRYFPLREIHPQAQLAAEAAEVVFSLGGPDAYWRMHDSLFADQLHLDEASLQRRTDAIGLDRAAFSTALRARRFMKRVERDVRSGEANGVEGTPAVFMNGVRYPGPRDTAALRAVIAQVAAGRPA